MRWKLIWNVISLMLNVWKEIFLLLHHSVFHFPDLACGNEIGLQHIWKQWKFNFPFKNLTLQNVIYTNLWCVTQKMIRSKIHTPFAIRHQPSAQYSRQLTHTHVIVVSISWRYFEFFSICAQHTYTIYVRTYNVHSNSGFVNELELELK